MKIDLAKFKKVCTECRAHLATTGLTGANAIMVHRVNVTCDESWMGRNDPEPQEDREDQEACVRGALRAAAQKVHHSNRPSEKQIAYLAHLIVEAGQQYFAWEATVMTKKSASNYIDGFKGQ